MAAGESVSFNGEPGVFNSGTLGCSIFAILLRLPTPTTVSESPLMLTEFGEQLAEWLDARAWADRTAETMVAATRGLPDFRIDDIARLHVTTNLGEPYETRVLECIYEFGTTRQNVLNVLHVVLRDALIEARQPEHDA